MIRGLIEERMGGGENARDIALDIVRDIRAGAVVIMRRCEVDRELSYTSLMPNYLDRSKRDRQWDSLVRRHIRNSTPIPADVRAKIVDAYMRKHREITWGRDDD